MTRIVRQRTAGEPQPKRLVQRWPGAIRHGSKPLVHKLRIRTLLKHNPAKDQAAQANLTDQTGVITGDRGGYKGGVKIVRQAPLTPSASRKNTKTIRPPRRGRLKRR